MSNKRINSVSFRLGVSRGWNTIGFFDSIFYNFVFFEDFWFKRVLWGVFFKLRIQFVGGVLFKRREDSIFITVHYANGKVSRPLPKTKKRRKKFKRKSVNNRVEFYRVNILKLFLYSSVFVFGNNTKIFLYFRRLLKWSVFGDSALLCAFISKKIKQRFSGRLIFSRLLRYYSCNFLKNVKESRFLVHGVRLKYTGPRGRRVGRAIQFSRQKGFISYETAVINVDYSSRVVITKFGCVNIEVWLNF